MPTAREKDLAPLVFGAGALSLAAFAFWSARNGVVSLTPGSAQTDLWAYNVAKTASPDMPEAYRQYSLAVARGEGFYGQGWGSDPATGAGSNNWGAVQGSGDAGSFQHLDHHADGSAYTTAFKKYSTPQAGFLDMASILLKPNVKAALDTGSLHDAVFAQHDNRYFELDPDQYLSAVTRNYSDLTANIGWSKKLSPNGSPLLAGIWVLSGAVIAGAVAWKYLPDSGSTSGGVRRIAA